jgi:vancomycin resistance protein VanJ
MREALVNLVKNAQAEQSRQRTLSGLLRSLSLLTWAYGIILAGFLLIRFALGDRTWWSFALNSLLLYAFLPMPFVFIVAWLTRRREIWLIGVAGVAAWAWLWGGLFLPRWQETLPGETSIRLMTYNLLGHNTHAAETIATIRQARPDVVALQELNLNQGVAVARELKSEFPYQWLEPQAGVAGCGLISRFPIDRLDAGILDKVPWFSTPMVARLDVRGRDVTLVHFHAYSGPRWKDIREVQAWHLGRFAQEHLARGSGRLIVMGDLNATDQNRAYALILAAGLKDAWREAGWGFGHTFPGADDSTTPGSSRPRFFGIPVPRWLVRIDYIFHSDDLDAVDAELGSFDGHSDHRPVVAELKLK